MYRHTIDWVDDWSAGIRCFKMPNLQVLFVVGANEPATPCPNCGQPITLFWDTHIVEEDEHG
jgi:hypothetical protein